MDEFMGVKTALKDYLAKFKIIKRKVVLKQLLKFYLFQF
jgi:hypothetical protein